MLSCLWGITGRNSRGLGLVRLSLPRCVISHRSLGLGLASHGLIPQLVAASLLVSRLAENQQVPMSPGRTVFDSAAGFAPYFGPGLCSC